MGEHTFPSGDWQGDDAWATNRTCDLAESFLDQVSRPQHDWRALSRETGALHQVALAMANRYGANPTGADQ